MFEAATVDPRWDDFVKKKRQATTDTIGKPQTPPKGKSNSSRAKAVELASGYETRGSTKGNVGSTRFGSTDSKVLTGLELVRSLSPSPVVKAGERRAKAKGNSQNNATKKSQTFTALTGTYYLT